MIKIKILLYAFIFINIGCGNSDTLPYSNCNPDDISNLFFKQNNVGTDTFKIINKNVFNQEGQQVYFPLNLEICKTYKYQINKDDNNYSILIKRINLSDIIFKYVQSKGSSQVIVKYDTVTLVPFGGNTLDVGYYYLTNFNVYKKGIIDIYINVEVEKCRYILFTYRNGDDLVDVPIMKLDDAVEPYENFVHSMIENLGQQYFSYNNSKQSNLMLEYSKSLNLFKCLLNEIRLSKENYKIENDSLALNMAYFYELDTIVSLLKINGLNSINFNNDNIQINLKDLKDIKGVVYTTNTEKVISNRFEKINFDIEKYKSSYKTGVKEFKSLDSKLSKVDSFYLNVFYNDGGGESNAHLITVWEKKDSNILLTSILDNLIYEGFGSISLDTILPVKPGNYILIGKSRGADGDCSWNSVWIGKWIYPRSLKIVYRKGYSNCLDSDNYGKISYSISNKRAVIINETIYKHTNNGSVKNDSTLLKTEFLLNKL